MPKPAAGHPARITIAYRLSARGRAAARTAGADPGIIQHHVLTPNDPAWPRALPLARADRSGRHVIDLDHDPTTHQPYAFDAPVTVEVALDAAEVLQAAAWVAAHGSDRLRRLASDGLLHVCMPAYWHERLTAERPGWRWRDEVAGTDSDPPTDPPEPARTLLARARRDDPTARLRRWQPDDDSDPKPPGRHLNRYAALGQFYGRPVVLFGPAYLVPDPAAP